MATQAESLDLEQHGYVIVADAIVQTEAALAARCSKRVLALVGYSLVEGTFVGYADGRHPRKLITGATGAAK